MESNYIKDAIRTESIEGAVERIGHVINRFEGLQLCLMVINKDIDSLKKYIYYGKTIEGAEDNFLNLDLNIPTEKIRLLHAGLGMLTEAEEFLTPVVNSILQSTELDTVNLKEELGDMQWYQAIACDVLGTTLEIEQDRNIAKLKTRYPTKYTNDAAISRDLGAERKVLSDDYQKIETIEVQENAGVYSKNYLFLVNEIEINFVYTKGVMEPLSNFIGKPIYAFKAYLRNIGTIKEPKNG